MKIGILTFHYGHNYGGTLQCYALYSYLKQAGHQVEVIDYIPELRPSPVRRIINKFNAVASPGDMIHKLRDLFKVKLHAATAPKGPSVCELTAIFEQFRAANLTFSPRVNEATISSLSGRYDAVIVGSDQVWTALYGQRHIYFLDWLAPDATTRRIAYAACSAHNFVRGAARKEIRALLNRFNGVSVRDLTTRRMVRSTQTDSEPVLVADPTLLHSFSESCFDPDPQAGPYILTYILGTEIPGGHAAALAKIKEQAGNLPVVSIVLPGNASGIEAHSDRVISNATVPEWVAMFKGATAVYTDSFHGIMFSIKFGKPFMAYYANAVRASRLIDLKTRFSSLPIYDSVPATLTMTYTCNLADFIASGQQLLNQTLAD